MKALTPYRPPLVDELVERALEAFLETNRWLNRGRKKTGSKVTYRGPTFDEVLHEHGITWRGDRRLYLAYARVVTERGMEAAGRREDNWGRGNAKLSQDEVYEVRRRKAAGETYRELADELDVSLGTVRDAVLRHTWKHLPDEEEVA